MSAPVSTTVFDVANEIPPKSSSTVSPAAAPDVPRATRNVVGVADSGPLSRLSESFEELCSAGTPGTVGATVSFVKASTPLAALVALTSITVAVSDLAPSAPRSTPETVKSTEVFVMSVPVSTTRFGVANGTPPRSSSTVSPSIAPDAPSPTRIVVAVPDSAAFSRLSASFVVVSSTGARGAVGAIVSLMKSSAVPAGPTFPARSMTRAVSDFGLSTPRSAPETVKSTEVFVMSVPVSTTVFGVANDAPPRSSSTVSPATAPDVPRLTRNVVSVPDSTRLRMTSTSLVETCSAGAPGTVGASVSNVKASATLAAPTFPA